MKPEKINAIFTSIFLIWCLSIICLISSAVKHDELKLWSNSFCTLIFFTAFFNVLAYFWKKCYFYLIGGFGFTLFFGFQCCTFFGFGYVLTEFGYRNYYAWGSMDFFIVSNFNFPLAFFGLFSTLFCFQQSYNKKFDENYHNLDITKKSKSIFLKFCSTDYSKILTLYNFAILLTTFLYIYCIFVAVNENNGTLQFHPALLLFLLPILTAIFNLSAIWFNFKKLCVVVISAWVLFSVALFACFCYAIFYEVQHGYILLHHFIAGLVLFLMYSMNLFICISTTFAIYCSKKGVPLSQLTQNDSENPSKYQMSELPEPVSSSLSNEKDIKVIFKINIQCCNYGSR